jgi:methylmalonyl-CoA/ethylmalonyl-CoA epimerase|tara:strand:+ start:13 stop:399 length:387 start_codon:yes stop_codon:yes gene_type:complete
MKFHHIGFLTTNIDDTFKEFKELKYKKKKKLFVDLNFKVKIQFIYNSSNIIELIKPHKLNFGLINILKNKNYAYHFAYKVKNLSNEIVRLEKKGFKLIVNPVPAIAFKNKRVAFLKMKNQFIIELIEQ